MTCAEVQSLFSEAYDRTLGSEAAAFKSHLETCDTCRREFDSFSSSLAMLATHGRVNASDDLEDRVLEAVTPNRERAILFEATQAPMTSRRAPLWIATAAGVLALVSFMVGTMVTRARTDQPAIAQANDRLVSKETAAPVDTKAIAEKIRQDLNLRQLNQEFVSAEFYDNVKKGNFYVDGRWITPTQHAEMIAKNVESHTPDKTTPDMEKLLTDAGYVKRGEAWMKLEDARRFDEGQVQVEPGKWTKMEDLESEFMTRHNLVKEDGKVMTREQRDEMVGERTVRKPQGVQTTNEVTQFLEGLRIGIPQTYGLLSIYPILGPANVTPSFARLHEALAAGRATIAETTNTFELRISNLGDRPIFIPAGTLLVGGNFARVTRTDVIVEGQNATIPVLCAQPLAFNASPKFSPDSGRFLCPLSIRRSIAGAYGQSAVWAAAAAYFQALRIEAKEPSLNDVYADERIVDHINRIRTVFGDFIERNPRAKGVAISVGERIQTVQLFSDPAGLAANFEQLLAATVLETHLQAKVADVPSTVHQVRRFIESAFTCEGQRTGEGYRLLDQGRTLGEACLYQDAVVSLSLVGRSGDDWRIEDLLSATALIPARKLERVVGNYEQAMLKAAGSMTERARLVRELSAISSPKVTSLLLRLTQDKDSEIKKLAVAMLGERQDRIAVGPLVSMLDKSRKDKILFPVLARCLARMPDPKCTAALLNAMSDTEAELVRSILEVLPVSILKIKDKKNLEEAVQRLTAYYDQMYTAWANPPNLLEKKHYGEAAAAAQDALKQVTAQDFRDPSECSAWWNKHKELWLSQMIKSK